MRRLKVTLSRAALNQIYLAYVRHILECPSTVWDGCTIPDFDFLKKLQNEAERIIAGLTCTVSLDNLYKECGCFHFQREGKLKRNC